MINIERLCDEFSRLAAISSPSFHEGEIADYLHRRFFAMGAQVEIDDAAAKVKGESGNLIACFVGTDPAREPLLLSAHMDTVSPAQGVEPVLLDGVFRSAGETVLGADDKSGIAQIIEAIETLQDNEIPYPPLEVVISVCEEVGLLGVKQLDCSQLKARRGLVLDTSGVGSVAHKAPCANRLRFMVDGIEAHAGLDPEHGISAIVVASQAIAKMKLGRIDEETTANIGVVNGGQAVNIIPKRVQFMGEARSFDAEKLQRQTEHMTQCLHDAADASGVDIRGKQCRAQVKVKVMADYPAMNIPLEAPVLQRLRQAAADLGQTFTVGSSGGGSDANIFNEHGIETANLATGMQQVHSVDEYIRVDDLVRVCRLLTEFIRIS
ncbi:MAG: M20/M25/M40 family metallo-hydrolase [Thermodesulfobacteriota bacterium]|nr:M20/M25/M40 family metallo-hydrolase [Thermodesulfobacteriota bacterium]